MLYYRVPARLDQHYRNPSVHDGNILIGGELYTAKEMEKYHLCKEEFELINVSSRKIYWSFGARFLEEEV